MARASCAGQGIELAVTDPDQLTALRRVLGTVAVRVAP